MAETSHARAEWNWQPEGPVQNNPLFTWPIDWRQVTLWYASSWHVISSQSLV